MGGGGSRKNASRNNSSVAQNQIQSPPSNINGGSSCPESVSTNEDLLFGIPIPSADGLLQFEALMFVYSFVSMLLQYLKLYQTVWWLPHSYNSFTMNFYLIDGYVLLFSGLILGRRLIWGLMKLFVSAISPESWLRSILLVLGSIINFCILTALLGIAYLIVNKNPIVNILYLTYPVFVYFLLFGFSWGPFLRLTPTYISGNRIRILKNKIGVYLSVNSGNTPFPEVVRSKVSLLKFDFNLRLKQILFNSLISAYYGTFIPCCFTPNSLHYNSWIAGRHVVMVLVGCFTLYIYQVLPLSYWYALHHSALQLGKWTKIEGRVSASFYTQWTTNTCWKAGQIIRHGKDLYRAEYDVNAAEPGNASHSKFFAIYKDASLLNTILILVQIGLVVSQHAILAWTTYWHNLLSESILLFANYYILFKVYRDYLIQGSYCVPHLKEE